jgi:hypothetical protein
MIAVSGCAGRNGLLGLPVSNIMILAAGLPWSHTNSDWFQRTSGTIRHTFKINKEILN